MLIQQTPKCRQIIALTQREHGIPEASIKDYLIVCRAESWFPAQGGSQCDSVAERAAWEGLEPDGMRVDVALLFCTR